MGLLKFPPTPQKVQWQVPAGARRACSWRAPGPAEQGVGGAVGGPAAALPSPRPSRSAMLSRSPPCLLSRAAPWGQAERRAGGIGPSVVKKTA